MRNMQPRKAQSLHRRPSHGWILALALALSLGFAGAANAGSVGIQFDISRSWVSILGGVLVIPPDGNLSTGVMRVVVPGNSATDIVSGAGIVRDVDVDVLSIDKNILSAVQVTGSIGVHQIGDAQGNLALNGDDGTLDLPFLLPSMAFLLAVTPNVNCAGALCNFLGSFPLTTPVTPILTGVLSIAKLKQSGNASFDQTFAITVSGLTGVVRLVGQEIRRTFVPEPSSAALVASGVLAAVALGGRVTRRSRADS